MAENSYFQTLTAPFRAPDVRGNVTFVPGKVDFTYIGAGIAFQFHQSSKNRYVLRAMYAGKFEEYAFTSQRDGLKRAIKILDLDRAGAFRARKSS